jgi:hypothetical protein
MRWSWKASRRRLASPIRPLVAAAADHGRRARELATGIGLCGQPCSWAARCAARGRGRTMGRVVRRDG